MKTKNTRTLILHKAVELFNKNGFNHVKINHIAEALQISLGNITYHFRTKEVMIEAILNTQLEIQRNFYDSFRTMPLFKDIDLFLENYFKLQNEYLFYFTDKLDIMRLFPNIKRKDAALRKWEVQLIYSFFQFNVARGVFIPEVQKSSYLNLSNILSWHIESWFIIYELKLQTQPQLKNYKESIWLLLFPYFTTVGLEEWQLIYPQNN